MKEITEYAVLARKLLENIEKQANEFQSSGGHEELYMAQKIHETVTDAAQALAYAITDPIIKYHNELFRTGEGISAFSYTALYFAVEYVTNILDAATVNMGAGFQEESKMAARFSARLSPVKINITKPI